MTPDIAGNLSFYVVLGVAMLVIVALTRRIPVLGRLVSIASWLLLAGLLFLVLRQHERFNGYAAPYVDRIAAMLSLDRQQVVGTEVRIRMASDGHFWANVNIGGVERRMLIDSGATVTAVSTRTAAAAGLEVRPEILPVTIQTANGPIRAETATIDDLKLGNIVARDLAVVVSPSFGDFDVIGMNFLSRLKSWRVEDNVLILVPHHPQEVG